MMLVIFSRIIFKHGGLPKILLSTFHCRLRTARDQWAKTESPNKDIKISIGALAGPNGTGYVDAATLESYIKDAQETCSSFGGVALWEASLAVGLYTRYINDCISSAC